MARFPYTKLNAKVNQEVVTIAVEGATNPIEVRQYLPIDEKLGLIGRVIELAHDTNNFSNPLKMEVYYTLEMITTYTNITFTEKQLEAPSKLYDALLCSGWLKTIMEAIPEEERNTTWRGVTETTSAFYTYRNSVFGVMEVMSQDYSDLNFDIETLTKNLSNGENVQFLKDVMTKLG